MKVVENPFPVSFYGWLDSFTFLDNPATYLLKLFVNWVNQNERIFEYINVHLLDDSWHRTWFALPWDTWLAGVVNSYTLCPFFPYGKGVKRTEVLFKYSSPIPPRPHTLYLIQLWALVAFLQKYKLNLLFLAHTLIGPVMITLIFCLYPLKGLWFLYHVFPTQQPEWSLKNESETLFSYWNSEMASSSLPIFVLTQRDPWASFWASQTCQAPFDLKSFALAVCSESSYPGLLEGPPWRGLWQSGQNSPAPAHSGYLCVLLACLLQGMFQVLKLYV